jgi:oxygen-independent coproporphyrinogen-3 oxidase
VPDVTTGRRLGVYVHSPFCERLCPYCDFPVVAVGRLAPRRAAEYVELLLAELELARRDLGAALEGRTLATLYFGGGTPALLEPAQIERVVRAVRAAFPGEPCEVTLELNPGGLEVSRLEGFRAAGITRLSVGVQSLHDETLRRLGRAQRAEETWRGLRACASAGFASLSADLIFGAPGQTGAELLEDLERVLSLEVPHVSLYALTLEPGTAFARARAAGRLVLPDEDAVLEMWLLARARLEAHGLARYEISSFARPGQRARHNRRYWQRKDVLGLGVGAASLLRDRRLESPRELERWAAGVRAGALARSGCTRLDTLEAKRETLALGLRERGGVSRPAYLRRFASTPERDFPRELEELRRLGLVEDRAARLRLTERGIRFADEAFLRFVGR